jgi:dTDP-4-dehydrorhamnose 3,5-epimerase
LFSHKHLPQFKVAQINCSVSQKNVIRGLHVAPFARLVYCVKGQVFDVVADVRKDSKTYLQYDSVILSGHNQKSIFIPPFCAHGFLAMEDESIVVYAQDSTYDPKVEVSVNHADPKLNIKWPWPILSEKDKNAPVI